MSRNLAHRGLFNSVSIALFALLSFSAIASAQVKIAVVNIQKAMLDSDELKKTSADLEGKYKPRQDELAQLQKDLESIQTQLASGKLTQAQGTDLQAQGTRKQRDAQRISEDLQADFDRDRQDILAKSAAKMQDVVKKIAEEKGYDIVIDVSQAVYTKPALDITADALAAYNKAYPAK
jgi:outer membrane protein